MTPLYDAARRQVMRKSDELKKKMWYCIANEIIYTQLILVLNVLKAFDDVRSIKLN